MFKNKTVVFYSRESEKLINFVLTNFSERKNIKVEFSLSPSDMGFYHSGISIPHRCLRRIGKSELERRERFSFFRRGLSFIQIQHDSSLNFKNSIKIQVIQTINDTLRADCDFYVILFDIDRAQEHARSKIEALLEDIRSNGKDFYTIDTFYNKIQLVERIRLEATGKTSQKKSKKDNNAEIVLNTKQSYVSNELLTVLKEKHDQAIKTFHAYELDLFMSLAYPSMVDP